jgi:hypothetical protein
VTAATGYDGLSTRLIPEADLRTFLLTCFGTPEQDLFVAHQDNVTTTLADVPEEQLFAVFCTWWTVTGDFAMGFSLGLNATAATRVGRQELIQRLAAAFTTNILTGDQEPPGLWTLTHPDGTTNLVALDEHDDQFHLRPTDVQ